MQGQDLSHRLPSTNEDNSTSQSTAQMNPYGNNHSASWFAPTNINTSTPVNEASFPFMDSMMDNLFSENVMRNISLQPAASGNPTSTTIGNANSILYGMDNYVNDVPQETFHSRVKFNIGKKRGYQRTAKYQSKFLRNKTNMNIWHQTASVSPAKMTAHLQIHYIMENIHPQIIEESQEQVR